MVVCVYQSIDKFYVINKTVCIEDKRI